MRNYTLKVKALFLGLLLMAILLPCLSPAAEDANQGVLTVTDLLPAAVEDVNKATVLTAIQQKMQQTVSVDFRETPIDDVLRMLAKQADIDIVKSPAVIGNVTATLTDVPLSEALDNILAAQGYGYIATENMIRVVPQKDIIDVREKFVNKVYRINYADTKQVEEALKKFISKEGSLSANIGTSNIIVTDAESKIAAIDAFIKEVDRVTQQVLVEVRVYDVTDTDSFDLGINWNAGRNTVNADGDLMTETTGSQTTTPGGIAYSATQPDTGSPATAPPLQTSSQRADPFAAGAFDKTNGGALRLGFFNNSLSLDVILTALQKQEWATLLANPSLMVLDNETARFEIIREIPYTENQQSSQGGTMTSTQFKDAGVVLEITPHITRDSMLRLHIKPEFSVEGEKVITVNNPYGVPAVSRRKLNTIALLKNEETVVLGGLRKQEVTKKLYKTPLLGDLPLVKGLFRSEGEKPVTTELLVFITPKIIDIPVLQSHETEMYKYTDIPSVGYPPLEHTKAGHPEQEQQHSN